MGNYELLSFSPDCYFYHLFRLPLPYQIMKDIQHTPMKPLAPKSKHAWIALIISLALGLVVLLQEAKPAQAQSAEPACIHGMRIVGEQSIYLSHMGLFDIRCHTYQGLFEVTFEGPRNPQQIYLNAQRGDAKQNEFTIEPTEMFLLPKFAAGEKASFSANLHRGQYERRETNPQLLAENVTVRLKRVLFFRQFKAGAAQPLRSEYLLFGSDKEQLAAHVITAPPDFDQVVALSKPLPLTNNELGKAVRMILPNRPTPNSTANLQQALKPGQQPLVQLDGGQPSNTIEAGNQYFLETADYAK
jgi:hypothetical protein